MAIHMIRVYSAPPSNANHFTRIQTACEDWAARYVEVLTAQRLPLTRITPADEGNTQPEHTMGHWRFDWSENHTQLLDDLLAVFQTEASWARLKYHSCDHDEATTSRGGCSWDPTKTREFGTIPAGIS